MISYRLLNDEDVDQFRDLRLEALREYPSAFGKTYEEEKEYSIEVFKNRLKEDELKFTFGAFDGDRLVANVTLFKDPDHQGNVVAMYCDSSYQGKGIAKKLLQLLIDKSFTDSSLKQLVLSVNENNVKARYLYESLGFVSYDVQESVLGEEREFRREIMMKLLI